jgi:MtN3 and saliva related transmembrane protein
MDVSLATLVGLVAGLCSTSSFIPQVLKAWREGDTEAISKRMYIVTVSAFSLWIAYGVMIESWPIIVFNIASLLLSGAILVLKLRQSRQEEAAGPAPAE